jgi:hypothetical protein
MGKGLIYPKWTIEKGESSVNDPNLWQDLAQMITAYWTSQAIHVAARLRIADQLKDGPRPA